MSQQPGPPPPRPEGELIAEYQKRSGLSVRQAARRAGISEGWWRQIVKGHQTLSGGGIGPVKGPAETVARMAFAVGVPHHRLVEVGRDDAALALNRIIREEAAQSETAEDVPAAERSDVQLERLLELWTRMGSRQRQAVIMLAEELLAAGAEPNDAHEGRSA